MKTKWGVKGVKRGENVDRQRRKHPQARGRRRRQRHCITVDIPVVACGQQGRQNRHGDTGNRPDRGLRRAVEMVAAGVRKALGDGITIPASSGPSRSSTRTASRIRTARPK